MLAYYIDANGKKGSELKTALCGIIFDRTNESYDGLLEAYKTSDVRPDGKIWDMYSNTTNYTPGNTGGNSSEGAGYNREHSFPASWFGFYRRLPACLLHPQSFVQGFDKAEADTATRPRGGVATPT